MRDSALGKKVGKHARFRLVKAAPKRVMMFRVILGLKLGNRIETTNSVTKQVKTVKKNGVKSGVNQAKSLGVKSGLEDLIKTWLGEKTGVIAVLSIGTRSGATMINTGHKF